MNDLMIQDGGALTLSDSDRIRIAAAWEALSANSRMPSHYASGELAKNSVTAQIKYGKGR